MQKSFPLALFPALAVLLSFAASARAQVYEWRELPHDASILALLEDGRQIGVYYVFTDTYRARLPLGGWSGPVEAPVKPPRRNFGVDEKKLHRESYYSVNRKKVERQAIEQVLQDSGLKPREIKNADNGRDEKIPDDSRKQRVTIIGAREQTERVLRDFQSHEALRPFKDRLLVAAYEPTHWCIQRQGFSTAGKPTIYVQDVNGVVLHRQDDSQGGAEELARVLRQIDPDYRPERDRDRRKGFPLRLPEAPWGVALVAGLAVVAVLVCRRK